MSTALTERVKKTENSHILSHPSQPTFPLLVTSCSGVVRAGQLMNQHGYVIIKSSPPLTLVHSALYHLWVWTNDMGPHYARTALPE